MKIFDNFTKFATDNKSTVLTGVGLGLSLTATALAVKFTHRITKELEETKKSGEDISVKSFLKRYWKETLLVIGTHAASAGFVIAGKKMDLKEISKLTMLGRASLGFAKKYEEKVVEQIGKKKNDELKQEARVESAPKAKINGSEVASLLDGDNYFKFVTVGKLAASSTVKIKDAVNNANNLLNVNDQCTFYDIFESIVDSTPCDLNKGLLDGDAVQIFGFVSKNGLIDVKFWDPQTEEINGCKISYIPVTFVDKKGGEDRDPTEYWEDSHPCY